MKKKFLLIVTGSKPYLSLDVDINTALNSILRAFGKSNGVPLDFSLALVEGKVFIPVQPFSIGENIRQYDTDGEYVIIHFNYGAKYMHFNYGGKDFGIDLRTKLVFVNYVSNNFTMMISKIINYQELFDFVNRIAGIKKAVAIPEEKQEVIEPKSVVVVHDNSDVKQQPDTTNLIINNNDVNITGSKRVMSNQKMNDEVQEYLEKIEVDDVELERDEEKA